VQLASETLGAFAAGILFNSVSWVVDWKLSERGSLDRVAGRGASFAEAFLGGSWGPVEGEPGMAGVRGVGGVDVDVAFCPFAAWA